MMDEQSSRRGQSFPVLCVWCRSEIRKGSTPESSGMCQRCFQQMIDEHMRRVARQRPHAHVSDR